MLTARGDEADRIVGLEIGADDYLPKTFSNRELLARLRAVTRRTVRPVKDDPDHEPELVVGKLRVNQDARTAIIDDQPLDVTPVEFDLLAGLARARGRSNASSCLTKFPTATSTSSTARLTCTSPRCGRSSATIPRRRATSGPSARRATC